MATQTRSNDGYTNEGGGLRRWGDGSITDALGNVIQPARAVALPAAVTPLAAPNAIPANAAPLPPVANRLSTPAAINEAAVAEGVKQEIAKQESQTSALDTFAKYIDNSVAPLPPAAFMSGGDSGDFGGDASMRQGGGAAPGGTMLQDVGMAPLPPRVSAPPREGMRYSENYVRGQIPTQDSGGQRIMVDGPNVRPGELMQRWMPSGTDTGGITMSNMDGKGTTEFFADSNAAERAKEKDDREALEEALMARVKSQGGVYKGVNNVEVRAPTNAAKAPLPPVPGDGTPKTITMDMLRQRYGNNGERGDAVLRQLAAQAGYTVL